MFTEKGVKSVR